MAKAAEEALAIPPARIMLRNDASATEMRSLLSEGGDVASALRGRTGSRLVLYFSGHGTNEGGKAYLVPSDVDPARSDDVAARGVAVDELLDLIERLLPAEGNALVVIEASFVGQTGDGTIIRTGRDREGAVTVAVPRSRPRIALALASQPHEVALGDPTPGRELGIFTDALIDGLYGLAAPGRNQVTLADLESFIARRVADRLAVLRPVVAARQVPLVLAAVPSMTVARFDGAPPVRDPAGAALEARECQLLTVETDTRLIERFLGSCRACVCAEALRRRIQTLRTTAGMAAADCAADERLWEDRFKGADAERLKQFLAVAKCPSVVERIKTALAAHDSARLPTAPAAPAASADAERARRDAEEKAKRDAAEAEAKRKAAADEAARSGVEQPREPSKADPELQIALIKSIQRELKRVGCTSGSDDGRWGPSVVKAIEAFSRITRVKLDSATPTEDALEAIKSRTARVCPLVCDDDEIVVGNACRPKPKAKIVAPKPVAEPKPAPKAATPAPSRSSPPGVGGDCRTVMFDHQTCVDGAGRVCIQRFSQRICGGR